MEIQTKIYSADVNISNPNDLIIELLFTAAEKQAHSLLCKIIILCTGLMYANKTH